MRALIAKELREQRWLFLACLAAISLGYARSLYDLNPSQAWLHVFRRSFLMVTSIGGAGFMVVLGFRQTFEEVRRGSWNFLVHRPLALTHIFTAKVATAAVLFGGAVLLPTVLLIAWYATPGHVAAPFSWPMVGPAVVDLFAALPYYFAGMVMGLWQARYTVSRGALIVAPLLNSVFAHSLAPSLHAALLSTTLLSLAYRWLARAVFMQHAPRSVGVQWALAGTLATALASLHLLAAAVAPAPAYAEEAEPAVRETERWFISREGDFRRAVVRHGTVQRVYGEDGQPIESDLDGMVWLHDLEAPSTSIGTSPSRSYLPDGPGYRHVLRHQRLAHEGADYRYEWYVDRDSGRLLAFDVRSRRSAGSLGPEGWSSDGRGAGFTGPSLTDAQTATPWWLTRDGLFRIDWERPSISRIALVGKPPYFDHALLIGDDGVQWHLVRSATHVDLFVGATPRVALPIDEAARGESIAVGRVEAENAYFIEYAHELVLFDAEGRVVRRRSLPKADVPNRAEPYARPKTNAALFVPPIAVWATMFHERGHTTWRRRWQTRDGLLALAMALAVALATLIQSRRHERGLRVAMALLAGLIGPLGLLLPRLLPSSRGVACPHCGARREPTPQPCPQCGKPLPGHDRDETAVIDPEFLPNPSLG